MKADVPRPSRAVQLLHLKNAVQMPLVVFAAYWLAANAAFLVGTLSDKIFAPFWPPNIVLLCALLLTPRRRWWLCLLAAFPAHVLAELQVGMGTPQLLVAFATNCMVALISAVGVQRYLGDPPWFDSLRKASLYVLITTVASPAVAALGGAFVPILGGGPLENYWRFWMDWYASNALGSVTLGPVALIALSETQKFSSFRPTRGYLEAAFIGLALVVVCILAFAMSPRTVTSGFLPALIYLPLPLILWAAVRFGATGASSAILVVTVVLIWCTLNSPGPFAAGDPETNVLAIQVFLVGLAVPTLLLGAAIEQTRRAEQKTRESEERMAFAAISANICLWHFYRKTDRVWMTDHGRRILGFEPQETITRHTLLNAIHPEDQQAALESMRSANAGQLVDTEFRVVRRDGEVRWIRARARTHTDERGEESEVSGTFADVTEHKVAESEAALQRRELAHLTRVSMLGELSGGLAHELTQPLTAILSNAQAARLLLSKDAPNLTEMAEVLDDIIEEDNRAGEVIHRLRDLLKKGETKFESVDLNELINSTLRLLHSELIGRGIRVSTELAPDLPPASGDAVQLQQVLLNLVMNAMDAMNEMAPSRRRLTIKTLAANGDVEVNVLDRGTGIDALKPGYVFQPFFTTKERGLGLGLSICSSIIKSHGGTLELINNPDGGATARFRLPAQSARQDALGVVP